MVPARRIGITALFIFVYCGICPTQKQKAIFEELIKNYLYKGESVLKI
jgi:hypothetical protein